MKTEMKPETSIELKGRIDYGRMPLLQLEGRIANRTDRQALKELHDNRLITHRDHERSFHPAEYLEMLKNSKTAGRWCGYENPVLEDAYNRTIDKFNNMPVQTDDEQAKSQGTDCRRYYLACWIYTTNLFKENPPANALQAEIVSAEMLRRMIDRQFYLSCLEARRKEYNFVRRYRWRLPQGDLYLWLPLEIPRSCCRQWLEVNIGAVDPLRYGEKGRVQATIDRLLLKRKIFLLSEIPEVEEKLPPAPDPVSSMLEEQITVDGLAEAVADEKAENIDWQMRPVQRLGKKKLKQLIHRIFDALARGEYVENRIAARYGLSGATFSRFAGARWNKNAEGKGSVPALWSNVAHTLAGHLQFVRAAKKAGVLQQVRRIVAEQRREEVR